MKHKTLILVVVGTLLALPVVTSAQSKPKVPGEDPLLGTWHLNVPKSTYKPGPAPKNQTRIYEKHRFGIQATVKTDYADGRSTTVQSVWDYDNMEHRVTGSEDTDSITVKQINLHTHEATMSHAGKETGTFQRVISKDGKQMTVTIKRGSAISVEVYEKDEQ
jgi:hypothetical protein